MAYAAYRHLVRLGRTTKLPITFLFVPEEEVGSPTSRAIIEREARGAKYALVCEPTTRSEEHTSELQSLMRISYAVFCLKKKKKNTNTSTIIQTHITHKH